MNDIVKLADYLLSSNNVMALTGAGMSTESGIPDFRSEFTGIWNTMDPGLICYSVLKDDPEVFYKHFKLLAQMGKGTKPNAGHYVLAELEHMGIIKRVLTQNIDGFHTMAGSKNVLEVHGNFNHAICMNCGERYVYQLIQDELDKENYHPLSTCCKATLRPSVVVFGDSLPMEYHQFLRDELGKVDFLLVMGTSLEVYPVADLPSAVGRYAMINKKKTRKDFGAKIVIHDSISHALNQLLYEIKNRNK
ncbi:MAG: Sir2 [Firmicutes bacterium]|nr:Sir2 [Bacillota bacterium]